MSWCGHGLAMGWPDHGRDGHVWTGMAIDSSGLGLELPLAVLEMGWADHGMV
jgi:hypothetical protein